MAVRQYIGARYTTKIYENSQNPGSAEWEAGATYEPLTLVTYLNGSYLSKKEVPGSVGNPPANPEYWVVTGAYNGQIASLQSQLDNINNNVIPSIEGDIDTLNNTTIPEIQSDIDTIVNTTIPGLAGNFEPKLANRKFIIIADSYGEERNGDDDNFIDVARDYLGLDNAHFIDCHLSSSGFSQSGTYNFLTMLEGVSVDRNSVTDIVVFAGANDINSAQTDTIAGLTAFMTWVKTNMPNATVYIGHIGIIFTVQGLYDRGIKSLPVYRECAKYGAHYIADSEYLLHSNNSLKTDHVHPKNSAIINYMGLQLATAILTGECNVRVNISGVPAVNTTLWSSVSFASGSYIAHIKRDHFALEGGPNGLMARVRLSSPFTPPQDTFTHLLILPDFPFIGTAGNVCYLSTLAVIKDNANKFYSLPCRILIDGERDSDNRIYATPIIDGSVNIANIVEISFYTYGCAYGFEF